MKKTIFACTALLTMATFCSATIPSMTHAADNSAIELMKKSAKWGLVLPNSSCVEQYQFLNAQELTITSASQKVKANYEFIPSDDSEKLPMVVFRFTADNQKADCVGNAQNLVGQTSSNYIKKESNQKILFCLDEFGKNCPVYLRPEL